MPNNPFIDLADENRSLAARVAKLEALIHRLRPSNRAPGCWCAPSWDTARHGHDETCQAAAALLSDKEKS